MVHGSTTANGVLLKRTVQRRGLARIDDLNLPSRSNYVCCCVGRDPAQPHQEVERQSLADEESTKRALDASDRRPGGNSGPLIHQLYVPTGQAEALAHCSKGLTSRSMARDHESLLGADMATTDRVGRDAGLCGAVSGPEVLIERSPDERM
jgi:hypothetical protein